ncbi:MAG: Piwi domain-containing protein [Chloroflexi bacterium]|nr:Piwi domain-containing protein [Chloroflexota bacterium]
MENTDTLSAKKLSLSLNKSGGSNRDYYSDRYDKIRDFVAKYQSKIFDLTDNISLTASFSKVNADILETKRYIFAGGSSRASQFTGIRDIGPLRLAECAHKVYFLFQESDRPFSYDLFRALRGDTFPRRFPGMGKMFDFTFDGTNVGGKSIVSFSYENVATAISEIVLDANGRIPMLLIVSPFDRFSNSRADRVTYMQIKHLCLTQEIPCQFVSIPLMRKKGQFEWAISSIGLQVFAKMGGWPWQVHHETPKCLIVGISQAHERKAGEVKKYFAYSTFTDSSGIYRELKVLSETDDHREYIVDLKRNLTDAITNYYADFDTFVIHTTFAIRRSELDAITEVISALETDEKVKKSFTVIKFNDDTRFFGYSADNNSMVPYESTYVQLSGTEYLMWFEGLQYQSERVPANLERPVHVKFIYPDSAVHIDTRKAFLQDALNVSGANWRGFNAKSLPVSVFYASLVAQFYRDCKKYGLEAIDLEAITPWFL